MMKSTTTTLSFYYAFVVVAVAAVVVVVSGADSNDNDTNEEVCDRCNFDGKDDFDTCKDYGLIDDTVLIGWNVGNDECMETTNIVTNNPIIPSNICDTVNHFVIELRFGNNLENDQLLGLGINSDGDGFYEDNTPIGSYNDKPTLKDTIVIDGTSHDCKSSASNCYIAMKPYFESTDGKQEMDTVCNQLSNKIKTDKQSEQSELRNRLCTEYREQQGSNDGISNACEPLWSQLLDLLDLFPESSCQGIASGINNNPNTPIPGCEDNDSTTLASSAATIIINNNWIAITTTTILVIQLISIVALLFVP